MRIAVVGATGRIGAKLTENLLAKGHSVKALSRGGPALDALVAKGAEPFLGSFDTGAGELNTFFEDALDLDGAAVDVAPPPLSSPPPPQPASTATQLAATIQALAVIVSSSLPAVRPCPDAEP